MKNTSQTQEWTRETLPYHYRKNQSSRHLSAKQSPSRSLKQPTSAVQKTPPRLPPHAFHGIVRANMPAPILLSLLGGKVKWSEALRESGASSGGRHLNNVTEAMIGFVPVISDRAENVFVCSWPFSGILVPAAELYAGDGQWDGGPCFIYKHSLLKCECVQIDAPSIRALVNIAGKIEVGRNKPGDYPKDRWVIALTWPSWESRHLTWPQRVREWDRALNRTPGISSENTLLTICKRMGLRRGDGDKT